ncbi:hypothetical protein [Arthrobacter sp. zg-Y1110]|uniref:hypothetical protein n=1 Tax=Arthrobacter sp. zg-Y1110 TaxID=2886932 RepID=UPI001D15B634|nr:hypothetical protein [Arthrobacter sp. zg-Y1110]MCC3292987.1 hypothetical protein [Arthrobacter sp. zg-Y1110]UWX86926.1 hypothetical protein N2K99_18960 [Arthrobacter sp. zg-Y1110]
MSERNFKERVKSDRDKDKQAIEDWMAGSGSKVFGGVIILVGVWFIINLFL